MRVKRIALQVLVLLQENWQSIQHYLESVANPLKTIFAFLQ